MKTTIDRQTGRKFRYDCATSFTCRGFYTVGRWDKARDHWVVLNAARLAPAMFAKLNPGKVQPPHVNPQDDPDLRSYAMHNPADASTYVVPVTP